MKQMGKTNFKYLVAEPAATETTSNAIATIATLIK